MVVAAIFTSTIQNKAKNSNVPYVKLKFNCEPYKLQKDEY